MALEQALEANTKALTEHTAALKAFMAAGGGTGGGAAAAGTTKTTKEKKNKATVEQMKAAVLSVKDHEKLGEQKAKDLISKHAGDGKKLADLMSMPDKFDAVVADALAMTTEADNAPDEEDESGGL